MLITRPAYFDDFHCIASACPDSCCKEWAVQVDDDMARFYLSLSGPLGDRLREVLREEDGEMVMTIVEGRCPMWRDDGLCRIQAELGEDALCRTCREFPRLSHDYGDFLERQLELSCPEAARILLTAPMLPSLSEEVPGGSEPDYDVDAMAVLKQTRRVMLELLADDRRSVRETLALALLYGCQAQGELDGEEGRPFDADTAMETIREFAKPGSIRSVLNFFAELEILTPQWDALLRGDISSVMPEMVRNLARYMTERYWLQAVSDYDLVCRVKFILISCLVVCALGGDFIATAQLFSKEIENNWDNVDAILDAAYSHPAFTDDKLLGMLLGFEES